MAKNLTKVQEKLLTQKKQEQTINDALITDAEELVSLGGKLTKIQEEHLKKLKVDRTLRTETVSLEKKLTKQAQSLNAKKSKQAILDKGMIDSLKESLANGDIGIEQFKSQVSLIEELASGRATSEEIQRAINDLGKDATDEMKSYLKVQKKSLQVQEFSKNAMSEFDGILGGMGSKIKGFITNPLTAAVALLLTFSATQESIGKQFGGIGVKKFRNELAGANQNFVKLGLSSEEAQSSVSQIANDFGIGVSEASKLSNNVARIAASTGMSSDEASKLVGLFTQTQGLTGQQAEDLLLGTRQLADANNVPFDKLLSDVAADTEVFARFSKDGGENLLRAAVQARKLGLDLSTVAKTADDLLDFQGSLTAEIEASVLLGRNVNLQKARELSLANDIEGLQKEIVKQVGTEAEFNKLNRIERDGLARAFGMNVADIQKLVSKQGEQLTLQGEINKLTAENEIPEDTLTSVAKILADFKSIGLELAESIGPSLNAVLGFANGIMNALQATVGVGPGLLGIFAAMKGHLLLSAFSMRTIASSAILTAFARNPIMGAIGFGLGVAAVTSAMSAINNVAKPASAQEGGITTQEGLVNVHPQEAIVPIEKLGGMIKDAMRPVVEENKRMREQNDTLIAETRKQAGRFATAMEGLS